MARPGRSASTRAADPSNREEVMTATALPKMRRPQLQMWIDNLRE
jgi:hypothetical protein